MDILVPGGGRPTAPTHPHGYGPGIGSREVHTVSYAAAVFSRVLFHLTLAVDACSCVSFR